MPGYKKSRYHKKTYLLVDGYNIIHAWKNLKKIAESSLENAREKLIHMLSNYEGVKNYEIIVVFDAHKIKSGLGSVISHENVTSVYTHEAETADHYIERVTKELTKEYEVIVATSDHLEQIIIMGSGARRMSARDLLDEIKSVNRTIQQKIDEIKPIKNNQLMDNLNDETAEWMEKLRRQSPKG